MKNSLILLLALTALPTSVSRGANPTFNVTTLPTPPGSIGTSPAAINAQRQIALNVGFPAPDPIATMPATFSLPYLYSAGTLTPLPVGGFASGTILGINDAGVMVGFVTDLNGGNFPALWSAATLTLLDHGAMPEGVASSINNQGQIAGAISTPNGSNYASHAALWNATSLVDLGNYGTTQAFAASINNQGQLLIAANAGNSSFLIHQQATDRPLGPSITGATAINDLGQVLASQPNNVNGLWTDGMFTPLSSTDGNRVDFPLAMNNAGEVVGYTFSQDFESKAVFWQGNQAYDLSAQLGLGWNLTVATGIADDGSIIALGTYQGQPTSVLLTPFASSAAVSPEPATAATLLLAAPLLLLRHRRKT